MVQDLRQNLQKTSFTLCYSEDSVDPKVQDMYSNCNNMRRSSSRGYPDPACSSSSPKFT